MHICLVNLQYGGQCHSVGLLAQSYHSSDILAENGKQNLQFNKTKNGVRRTPFFYFSSSFLGCAFCFLLRLRAEEPNTKNTTAHTKDITAETTIN